MSLSQQQLFRRMWLPWQLRLFKTWLYHPDTKSSNCTLVIALLHGVWEGIVQSAVVLGMLALVLAILAIYLQV